MVCARGLRRRSGRVPVAVWPVTSRTSAVSPTLMPPSWRSATSTTASIGSSATICAISRARPSRSAAPPTSTGTSVTTPAHGARTMPRSRSASAAASVGLGGLELRFEIDQFELRHGARSRSACAWPRARSCAGSTSACACATCASRASSDRTAMTSPFFTRVPRCTRSSVSTPPVRASAMTLLVGLGAAGSTSLRLCGTTLRLDHGDAEQLLGRAVVRCEPRRGFRRLVRQEMPGRDPERGGGDQADGGDAASLSSGRPPCAPSRILALGRLRSMWRVMSMNIGSSASGSKCRIERAAPPDAVGDDHQHGRRRRRNRRRAGCRRARRAARSRSTSHFFTSASNACGDARDLRIAARLRHDLGAELHLLVGRSAKWWCAMPSSTAKKSLREIGAGELLRRPRRGRARRCRR